MAQKRRITPQLINLGQPAAVTDSAHAAPALLPVLSPTTASETGTLSLREQSEYAARVLGPGRRMYVELGPDTFEVNWQKVIISLLTCGICNAVSNMQHLSSRKGKLIVAFPCACMQLLKQNGAVKAPPQKASAEPGPTADNAFTVRIQHGML